MGCRRSRPIQINESLLRGQAAPRNRPIGDASARLAAIDHRQAQLRAMAAGGATEEEGHFYHTSDSMMGREPLREPRPGSLNFSVSGTTHPHNSPMAMDGRRIK